MEEFEELTEGLQNQKGKCRTFEENQMLLFAIKAALKRHISKCLTKGSPFKSINCLTIDAEVASDFCYRRQNVTEIQEECFKDGGVVIYNNNFKNNVGKKCIFAEHLQSIIKFIDSNHSKVMGVTAKKVRAHLLEKFQLDVSKITVNYCMKKLGLSYHFTQASKRNMNGFQPESILEFLIKYDEIHIGRSRTEKYNFTQT